MYISYNWLKDFVDFDLAPQELADRLTLAGIAVESVTELGKDISGVVTGRIEKIDPHPNADKLVITRVNTGEEKLQIITAATNVKEGDVIPVALEGAKLAGGFVIKRAKLRGVESRGMMCSGQELGIDAKTMSAEQAHGIMILPPGTPLGRDAKEILGLNDFILELDLTPNRGDCLSVVGVAREVAALLGRPFRLAEPSFPETGENISGQVRVDIDAPDLCRRYVARLIKNVRIGRSPLWMQSRLRAAGMRPISNLVDVTNYVMLEMGQPLHAFDYDKLVDHHIIVRRAKDGENMVSLDEVLRELNQDMLVIADPSGPVAVAGVMGGLSTEVTDNTTSILLESAYFNPVSIRRTSKSLGLRSEASLRFEKGIDLGGCLQAINRAAQLIYDMDAGDVVNGVVDNYISPVSEKTIMFRPKRATYVLGLDIPKEKASDILSRLQFKVQDAGADLLVTVPTYRVDVSIEEDLIEEVARIYGYHEVPATLPSGSASHGAKTKEQSFRTMIADAMAGAGFNEVVTYSFTNPRVFDLMNLPADSPFRNTVKIQNPLSEEHSVMRTMMLPGLLEVLAKNFNRRMQEGAVFELGTIFTPGQEGHPHEERHVLAAAAMGRAPGNWKMQPREFDFYFLKGVLESIFRELGTEDVKFYPEKANPSFHPGRTATLDAGERKIGIIGELHPSVLEKYDLPERVVAFEIDFEGLYAVSGKPKVYNPLPKFPGVERDLAIVLKRENQAGDIMETIRKTGGKLLRSVSLFDIYHGEQVPAGYQSMAFALKFQAADRTLTDAEVSEVTAAIAAELSSRFGAQLRG
ncbi:phenylalanine--tRNA ligase subunit beta [Pelotomaculum sp. PtaB.Bin117]|uniref:phenylalanine--tRNA ligase subunit beta n=1 Tax=Pelotomaculum sp. PtaB.Bin117 TaxID=1811694 RepID=UPI0009C91E6E|nr:phenylalanine--tRNA ligase subunit beta [Pelotomaculum sp. PtaB.Bin117]OPX83953.1 MAG: Phenylalanine--tRNA ligase beta subunit [Pelotomaculum sp. PtaB.Bin117]